MREELDALQVVVHQGRRLAHLLILPAGVVAIAVYPLVLRILALLCFVKAISSTLGPVLYVVHAQRQALQFIAVAVAVKVVVVAALAARFGYVGVAVGALGVELCFGVLPAVSLLQRFTGYRLRWTTTLKVVMVTAVAAGVPWQVSTGGLSPALLAPVLYVPLAFLSGAVRLSDVRALLGRRQP